MGRSAAGAAVGVAEEKIASRTYSRSFNFRKAISALKATSLIAIHSGATSGTGSCNSLILHDIKCHSLHRVSISSA